MDKSIYFNKCKDYKKVTSDKKGFTLIELIIVVAILGVLTAMAVPKFFKVQEKAKQDADKATLAMITKSVELYYHQGLIKNEGELNGKVSNSSELKKLLEKDFSNLVFQYKEGDKIYTINEVTITFEKATDTKSEKFKATLDWVEE